MKAESLISKTRPLMSCGIAGEKTLDVVAINGPPPVETELAADGLQPPEVTETYAPNFTTSSPAARCVSRRLFSL